MDIGSVSCQERYHASEIFTLRCRILDRPGMLGRLITALGQFGVNIGSINVTGLDNQNKVRDITVYCSDKEHLGKLLDTVNSIDGVEVLFVRDDVMEIHRRGTIETVSRVPIENLTICVWFILQGSHRYVRRSRPILMLHGI